MGTHSIELSLFKEAFGRQDYKIFSDSYRKILLNHPLLQGIYSVGSAFILLSNTHTWEIEAVSGETVEVSGYTREEITEMGSEFILNFSIPEHMHNNMATVKACMEYSNSCPEDQRNRIFAIYFYHARKKNGAPVTIQHQSLPLVFDEQMIPFVFCNIYTDITYLDAYNIPQGVMVNKSTHEVFYLDPDTLGLTKRKEIFSDREKELIRHLLNGLTSKEIAGLMHISIDTVRTHRKNILNKAGISNTVSLIKYSITNGIL